MSTTSTLNEAVEQVELTTTQPEAVASDSFEFELGKACRIDNPDCESCQ